MQIHNKKSTFHFFEYLIFNSRSFLLLLIFIYCVGCHKENFVDDYNDDNNPSLPDKTHEKMITLGNPENIYVEYGSLTFGAETPSSGRTTGLNFDIRCVEFNEDGGYFTVFGLGRSQNNIPQVWRAETIDGINYHNSELLYEIQFNQNVTWNGGDIAIVNNKLYLLHAHLASRGADTGHPFHAFSGKTDGTGWIQLNTGPIYHGQDALSMVWNSSLKKFINYQTSYQSFSKKFPDNMPNVRRVLHIRTSYDCINWIPGESFAVNGPHLPDDQLIVPDSLDSPDNEFYRFSATDFGEFWAGIMINYISQPKEVPYISGSTVHGPYLYYEWWISSDGLNWKRPFRQNSGLDGITRNFAYLGQPVQVGDELIWADNNEAFSLNRKRMFYAYSRANVQLVTNKLKLSGVPITLELSFDAINRGEEKFLEQGFIMIELLDAEGRVIPGFEKEKCLFTFDSSTQISLKWGQKYLPDLATYSDVRLRILSRDARLYSIAF